MSAHVRDGSTWRTAVAIYVRDGSTWRTITSAYVRDGTNWRQFWVSGPTINTVFVSNVSHYTWGSCPELPDVMLPGDNEVRFSSYCTVNDWDGTNYKLDVYYRVGTTSSCPGGSYTLLQSDVTVTTGTSSTVFITTDDCVLDGTSNTRSIQFEWRVIKRSDSSLNDSDVSSCPSEQFGGNCLC